jgi:hypothetical protein
VIPAAVQIALVFDVTSNGVTESLFQPMGSGTVVSADGVILINWHVIDMAAHRATFDEFVAQAAAEGLNFTYDLDEELVLILTSDGLTPPEPRYVAEIEATDPTLDLAVLRIVGDESFAPLDPASLNLPFVPLGDSDSVGLGDPVDIFGYPAIASGVLTYTEGVVSGFLSEGQVDRAWIHTDATMSSGSSGGTAINREGALIGVPTQGTAIDCRPGDVNLDGRVDAQDVGCIPIGGSIGQLRPVNLAYDLLARAGVPVQPGPVSQDHAPGQADPQPEPQEPVPTEPDTLPLPQALPLAHSPCFRIENDVALTLEELVARLGGTDEARSQLQSWGWQASRNRVFACDTPPEGGAGWIDIGLHLFADAASAQQAVDYFAAQRAAGSPLIAAAPPAIGDYAAVLSGPATNGKEFTLYASQGPLLIRVTGVSSSGIPFINVLTVAQGILEQPPPQALPREQTPSTQDAGDFLLTALPLGHASCFRVDGEGTLDFPALVERFPGVPDAAARLQTLGWQVSAYRQFGCDGPPPGTVGWVDMSVHQFQDAASAAAAVPFFASSRSLGSDLVPAAAPDVGDNTVALTGRASNGTEYTLYTSTGPLLFRVTGVAPAGDPAHDVEQVMRSLLVGTTNVNPDEVPSPDASAPATVIPANTPAPTTTPVPTRLPRPTAVAVPTATATPQPTLTPRPTQTPVSAEPIPRPLPTLVVATMPAVATGQATATTVPPTPSPPTPTPTMDADALLDRLLTTPFPQAIGGPRLGEDGGVEFESFGWIGTTYVGQSGGTYEVYADAREAERDFAAWQQDMGRWLDAQIDVSGPELGPHAVLLFHTDDSLPTAVCGTVIDTVVVRVSAVGDTMRDPDVDADDVNTIVVRNCQEAVAHLRSVVGSLP